MQVEPIYIYTDASFRQDIGVSGFLLFNNTQDHEAGLNYILSFKEWSESSNIRVELMGAIVALTFVSQLNLKVKVHFYTDCKAISGLLERRKKLESVKFVSKKKNSPLTNADLYQSFFKIYDQVMPEINWIKGHTPAKSRTVCERNFSLLDKAVRKKLRLKFKTKSSDT